MLRVSLRKEQLVKWDEKGGNSIWPEITTSRPPASFFPSGESVNIITHHLLVGRDANCKWHVSCHGNALSGTNKFSFLFLMALAKIWMQHQPSLWTMASSPFRPPQAALSTFNGLCYCLLSIYSHSKKSRLRLTLCSKEFIQKIAFLCIGVRGIRLYY